VTEPKTQTERAAAFIESESIFGFIPDRQYLQIAVDKTRLTEILVQYESAATRDLREQLEAAEAVIRHYAADVNWNVRKITSDHPCEYCGYDREIYEYDGPTDNGTKLAQEYLKKHGGE
jgi:hypothetical protein